MKPSLAYLATWIIPLFAEGTLGPSFGVRAMVDFYSYNAHENFPIK